MKLILLIFFLTFLLLAPRAEATLDLRYSMMELTPTDLEDFNAYHGSSMPAFKKMGGFAGDAMVSLPGLPVSLGVRYERFTEKGENGSGSFDSTFERQSLLVVKRYIDYGVYAGLVATVDFGNKFTYKKTQSGVTTNYKAKAKLTGSIGAEAGIKLLFLRIGVEGGYLYAPLGNLKFATTDVDVLYGGNPVEVNLSGSYVRGVVGLSF